MIIIINENLFILCVLCHFCYCYCRFDDDFQIIAIVVNLAEISVYLH